MTDQDLGPTGEICFDLPSPYAAHPCGLLYLPRFIAKCHKHLAGELPKSYQKNFCRGFDRFLSMHLDIDPKQVLAAVEAAGDDEIELDCLLGKSFLTTSRPSSGTAKSPIRDKLKWAANSSPNR